MATGTFIFELMEGDLPYIFITVADSLTEAISNIKRDYGMDANEPDMIHELLPGATLAYTDASGPEEITTQQQRDALAALIIERQKCFDDLPATEVALYDSQKKILFYRLGPDPDDGPSVTWALRQFWTHKDRRYWMCRFMSPEEVAVVEQQVQERYNLPDFKIKYRSCDAKPIHHGRPTA